MCSLFANSNRDPKKQKRPFKMDDFFLYKPKESQDIPTSTFGSAAMALIEKGLFPNWALFVYKDLKAASNGAAPRLLAYLHENAIILAPVRKGNAISGMLICDDKSFNKTLQMKSPCGEVVDVFIPAQNGRYAAIENIELTIMQHS